MNRGVRPAAVATLLLAMAGCATNVPQILTPTLVPGAFVGPVDASARVWPSADWWLQFGNSELAALVEQGQADNYDLAVAAARIMEAGAAVMLQRSALFPQINAQATAQRGGGSSNSVSTLGTSSTQSIGNTFVLSLGASYELDFWGLARDNLRAAREALKAAHFEKQVVAITVTANIADQYVNILALRQRIALANANIVSIKGILDTIKLKVTTGSSSHLDLAQETAQLESVAAELPGLEEQEAEARFALALLVGRAPEKFAVTAQNLDALVTPTVAPGLPSELLLRRPDVARAEANLARAHADLDAARAAFLPQISLTGDAGFAGSTVGTLVRGSNFGWDYGANLVQAIFDGGKLVGQKELAKATQQELVSTYRAAVLNALLDVESALGQVANDRKSEDHLKQEVSAAREAFQIAELQYRQGTTDLLNVLQAQQTLFSAEDVLAQTTQARMQAVVHLYEALGGGWSEDPRERTQVTLPARR